MSQEFKLFTSADSIFYNLPQEDTLEDSLSGLKMPLKN
jgi:hypothetical protein